MAEFDKFLVARTIPTACFAPALTDEKLEHYKNLIDQLPESPLKTAMETCYKAVEKWWNLPESKGSSSDPDWVLVRHGKQKTVKVTSLDKELIEELWDVVPWDYELQAMQPLFDAIDPVHQKELRDAAFHLLWFATELTLDREPLTKDRLDS